MREHFNRIGCAFIAFDHRGHGQSSGAMKELTVTRNLEDLDAIITTHAMHYKQRILIGSSMGGQTAAWYAARHPDRISANLLIAPAFRFFQNRLDEFEPELVAQLKKEGSVTFKNAWTEVTIGRALFDDAVRYPMETLLPDYRTPTLIIHGTEDDSVPIADSVRFVEQSRARPLDLLLIGGGDHRLSDHKATLFQEMQNFCQRINLLSKTGSE